MKLLLDTNAISDLYKKTSRENISSQENLYNLLRGNEIYVSSLSIFELEYGYAHARTDLVKNQTRSLIDQVLQDINILDIVAQAFLFGELKEKLVGKYGLKKEAAKKHMIDVILASQAVLSDCVLVSRDSIFKDLQVLEEGLKWETWE